MEELSNPIIETREEFMISPTSEETPSLRTAHFIRPSINTIKGPVFDLPSHGQLQFDSKKYAPDVCFNAWTPQGDKWKIWVDRMTPIHGPSWKQTGIYEAIMSSKYQIFKDNNLVHNLVEKWCSETNSFIFSWGEVTITLEDTLAFGFSVLGSPVFSPLETDQLKEIEERLETSRRMVSMSASHRASINLWIDKFMDSESDIEHEAFLAVWLSRYVLVSTRDSMRRLVFPVAVHLARGTRIALGPAVLASIYRDLTMLKEKVLELAYLECNQIESDQSTIYIKSPFHLVQVWAWERFVELCPQPHLLYNGEPRLARWNKLKQKIEKVSLVLDSAKPSFKWRPYVEAVENWDLQMICGEKSMWVGMASGVHEELMLFAKCLRVSSLIGLECKENYYPHRVAMQFGFDQDLPGFVYQFDETDEIAWQNYDMPVDGLKLYVPSRSTVGRVTTRYAEWWKQTMLKLQDSTKNVGQQERGFMPSRAESKVKKQKTSNTKVASASKRLKEDSATFVNCSLPLKSSQNSLTQMGSSSEGLESLHRSFRQPKTPEKDIMASGIIWEKVTLGPKGGNEERDKYASCVSPSNTAQQSKLSFNLSKDINEAPAPPGFPLKYNMVEADNLKMDTDNMNVHKWLIPHGKHITNVVKQHGSVQNSSAKPLSQAYHFLGGKSVMIMEDDDKLVDKFMSDEAINHGNVCQGSAVDQQDNQPSSTDSCAVKDTTHVNTPNIYVKGGNDVISTYNGIVEDANLSNAESRIDTIPESSLSCECNCKKYILQLEARVQELEKRFLELKAARFR